MVLVAAETFGTQHVLGDAVYHKRESVVDPPVLDLLRRLFPLRYLGRELVLVEIDVPRFAFGPLRKPSLYDNLLALFLRLLVLSLLVIIHVHTSKCSLRRT